MKYALLALLLVGCTTGSSPSARPSRLLIGIVTGKVVSINFAGFTGTTPLIVIGTAHVTISAPASLAGRDLLIGSSEDYPFKIGDLVELDFSGFGLDVRDDGQLSTSMLYRFPVRIKPNQALEPTTLLVTIRAAARLAPSRVVAHL